MTKRKEQQEKLAAIWAQKSSGPARRNQAANKTAVEETTRSHQVNASERNAASPLGLLSDALKSVTESKTSSTVVGEIVVIPSEKCVASFVRDRFDFGQDPDFVSLKESIRESGQQLPILVRPHPVDAGCYQIAFGHRRHRACQELGFPIRAVVKEMTDEEVVIAQGQENNEREDLSFIEVALFAARLRENFTREVVMSAIGKNSKNYISMLSSITNALPLDLVKKIGKAKGVGRPRWEKLASFFIDGALKNEAVKHDFEGLLSSDNFGKMLSAERFNTVLSFLDSSAKPSTPKEIKRILTAKDGNPLGELVETEAGLRLTIKRKNAAGFADYLSQNLNRLIADFETNGGCK